MVVLPEIKGHENYNCPSYSFLISHGERHILFDIGARKDLENLAPETRETALEWGKVERDVADILEGSDLGIKPRDIEAVIFSHHHWDHIGNMATFPASTDLIVGPGFKEAILPGYPSDPESDILESDYANRLLREIDIVKEGHGLEIGRFNAYDYFNDGSFYLLNAPGHAPGHMTALARVTNSPDTFIFLAADACDHGGELRPTEYQPLPAEISPSPSPRLPLCPGSIIQRLHPEGSVVKPFYLPQPDFPDDLKTFTESLCKLQEMDAHENILVAMAHDVSLKNVLSFFPERANHWRSSRVKEKLRWLFLNDFRSAIDELAV